MIKSLNLDSQLSKGIAVRLIWRLSLSKRLFGILQGMNFKLGIYFQSLLFQFLKGKDEPVGVEVMLYDQAVMILSIPLSDSHAHRIHAGVVYYVADLEIIRFD